MSPGALRAVLVALIGVGLLAIWLPAVASEHGRIGIRLVEAPVERADDPRAHSAIVDHLEPGTEISRQIEVINDSPDPWTIDLYAAAADVDDGWQVAPGREGNELTDWTTVQPERAEIPPHSTDVAEVTIDVPDDTSEAERYAVIWAHPVVDDGEGVQVVNRVGVRVYLSVGPGGEPPADLEIISLRADRGVDGDAIFVVGVENTGGRALDLSGEVMLPEGPGGVQAGPFDLRRQTLEIGGETAMVAESEADLPAGEWRVDVEVRSGRVDDRVEATLVLPEAPGIGVPRQPERPTGWTVSVLIAGLLLGLTVAALAAVTMARRRGFLRG